MIVPLLDRANVANPTVAANIMDCIGELSVVAAEDALSFVPGLMKIILAQLVEPIPIKRDAALRALGQVCSNTGYVIQPLVDYPELWPILHRIMKSETSSTVRREVLRVLGILGAIDPYRRRVSRSLLDQNRRLKGSCSPYKKKKVQQIFLHLPQPPLCLLAQVHPHLPMSISKLWSSTLFSKY